MSAPAGVTTSEGAGVRGLVRASDQWPAALPGSSVVSSAISGPSWVRMCPRCNWKRKRKREGLNGLKGGGNPKCYAGGALYKGFDHEWARTLTESIELYQLPITLKGRPTFNQVRHPLKWKGEAEGIGYFVKAYCDGLMKSYVSLPP